ncbi:hypothetical protein BDD12DRAFT_884288 [Trichophaea hybrida]|nr:hypothetical protein BDD12DRAFT_884288 [Trichophaea hybrida]
MYPPINVSNTELAPPNTNAASIAPAVLHFYLHTSAITSVRTYICTSAITSLRSYYRTTAVTSHRSKAMIGTIEFPFLCITVTEIRLRTVFSTVPSVRRHLGRGQDGKTPSVLGQDGNGTVFLEEDGDERLGQPMTEFSPSPAVNYRHPWMLISKT